MVHIEAEEIPKKPSVNYIIEAATMKSEESKTIGEKEVASDITIVYSIDVSGSMNTEVGRI